MPDTLFKRCALPDDPDLDSLSTGLDEVDEYFRSRRWFSAAKGETSPPTYQFLTDEDGEVVGYASVSFRRCGHSADSSDEMAKFLVVYAVGLHIRFQGKRNPRSMADSYAISLFRILESFARDKPGCVGLYLWVRADNARGIGFYEKFGFIPDPDGPVQRDDKVPHLSMRRLL